MSDDAPIKLRIPRQDLETFSEFSLTAEGASGWVQSLPVANARLAAQRLREVLENLNRCPAAPELRHQILEQLLPALQVSTTTLSRRFLNQPLVLPKEPRQIALLTHQLYGLAATGYTLVAVHAIRERHRIQNTNPARLVCEALQRATSLVGGKLFQAFLLYQGGDGRVWHTLHQLYALAERQQLTQLRVRGISEDDTTITATYVVPLLLACCKPNQLRQSDLAAIYRGFQEWSQDVRLLPASASDTLFAIDLSSDQPPIYTRSRRPGDDNQIRALDTGRLLKRLVKLEEEDREAGRHGILFDSDTRLHSNILRHVIDSLSSVSMRNFNRSRIQDELWVALGLSSAHYHCAGGLTLKQVLYGADYRPPPAARVAGNPFLARQLRRDPWEEMEYRDIHLEDTAGTTEARPIPVTIPVEPEVAHELLHDIRSHPPEENHPQYRVRAVNASPGGFCLTWDGELPGHSFRTGDILGLREEGNSDWLIADIRWISALEGESTMVGVELLSPRAIPYGACIQKREGGQSDPIRVLVLPEIKLVGQPNTLITPRSGFKEGQKLLLKRHGEELRIMLHRQLAATATFSRFEYRVLRESHTDSDSSQQESALPSSPFKSIWSDI